MTTGPFNINGTLPIVGRYHSEGVYANGLPIPPTNYSISQVGKTRVYIRDKSINNPPTKNHWREPTAWNSRTMSAVNRPAGIFQNYAKTTYPSSYWVRTSLSDGYGSRSIDTDLPATDVQKWIDVTVTKCLLKLKNQRVNVSNAFGERREVVRMFEHLSKATLTGLFGFKQSLNGRRLVETGGGILNRENLTWSKVKNLLVKDLPSDLHNHWLEYIYGLSPLMQDLYGSMEALAYRESDGNAYRITVTSSHREIEKPAPVRVVWADPGDGTSAGFDQYKTIRNTVHTSLTYVMENPFLRSLSQLGITNPAVTAWELTRLSFLADWILPIGDYLQTWDADFGFRFKGGTTGVLRKGTAVFLPYTKDSIGSSIEIRVQYFIAAPPQWQAATFTRQKYYKSPLPGIPHFKNPLSGIHLANALALLRGAFS